MDEAAIRADERDKIAYHITAELVCCDIYERLERAYLAMVPDKRERITPRDLADRLGMHFHHLCYYGAWAASLAKEGPKGDPRGREKPCVVNGGQRPCEPIYWCPTTGEYESPCHGGFDVCCRRPEMHRGKP